MATSSVEAARRSDGVPTRPALGGYLVVEVLADEAALQRDQLTDAGVGQIEQAVQRLAPERQRLGRALQLDVQAAAGLHDVHVHVGLRVLGVGQVEQRLAVHDADAGRGHEVGDRHRAQHVPLAQLLQREHQRDEGAGDRRRARAAVGLDDVAVERDGPLAELLQRVTARSERPISRWISCVRPPTRPAEASRCVRVDVARGSMPYSAVTQPLPLLRRNGGTRSSTLAVQITLVRPASTSTEPSAWTR